MKEKRMTCDRARNICLVSTLANLGHYPTRKTEKEAWFLSPFRSETQASFKVSLTLNRWYDHGLGKGGNTIDLLVLLMNIPVKEALDYLNNNQSFSFHQQPISTIGSENTSILDIKRLSHPALYQYLKSRGISMSTGRKYLKEVHYERKQRIYFSLGLQNVKGGWELRNKYQKTSSSPKAFTLIKKGRRKLLITEGMFDLLSLDTINPLLIHKTDLLVLNSLSFVDDAKKISSTYRETHLYLDNDTAGDMATQKFLEFDCHTMDCRNTYSEFKDLNEKLLKWN
ncbi:toprim domain-containing protein [Zobellia uliginosa]|uniref:toprim domain-containing protein n=1 Tax=Zobellia uliginosa TaxID=143224 RepID=UPI0026E34DE4|nr:toprim domain-containing protein [Zobellia uliginosa]MDO6516567.1 toprim domain-containing protein [Zobellia uliginosa]